MKKQIALGLFNVADKAPKLRNLLAPLGLRMNHEWLSGCKATLPLHDGASLTLTNLDKNYLSFQLFWLGFSHYEPITSLVLGQLLTPGATFLDVGSNIGFFSLTMAKLKPGIKVYAFEPNPKMYAILGENVGENRLFNIIPVPLALSDREGTAHLYLSDSDMSASLRSNFDSNNAPPLIVEQCRLDAYLRDIPVPGELVIKVDVEGHDRAFFSGAMGVVTTHKPDIICEVAIRYRSCPFAFLKQYGYRFYKVTDQGLIESEKPEPIISGRYFFPNYLFTVKPPDLLSALFSRIQPILRTINLDKTSKNYLPPPREED